MASKRIMKWGIKKTNWWCSFKYSGLLALLSGEPISASVKTSNPFCFRGLRLLDPQRGAALYPAGGLGGPQTPRLLGGLWPPVPLTHFKASRGWYKKLRRHHLVRTHMITILAQWLPADHLHHAWDNLAFWASIKSHTGIQWEPKSGSENLQRRKAELYHSTCCCCR